MIEFFHTTIFVPLYNLLIYLVDVIPGGDWGLAVVGVTVIVKVVTAPLSFSALKTQRAMKVLEPKLTELKEKYKDDKETQAREMFALYKQEGVKPFSSILLVLIQIPILLSLYYVFFTKSLTDIDTSILYSFVPVPEVVSPLFLGFITIAGSSLILAAVAALSQFAQAYFAIPVPPKGDGKSMGAEFGRAMAMQARFVLPLIIGVVAYTSGAIALYFITSNIIGIAQEFIVRKILPKKD